MKRRRRGRANIAHVKSLTYMGHHIRVMRIGAKYVAEVTESPSGDWLYTTREWNTPDAAKHEAKQTIREVMEMR